MSYTVDYEELGDLGAQLGKVRDEFNGVEDNIRTYDGVMGSGNVVEKLHQFSDNWSDKREELAKNLDGVSQAAIAAADAYRQTDQEISKSITGPGQ
jgi:uncharacterized protein YukE